MAWWSTTHFLCVFPGFLKKGKAVKKIIKKGWKIKELILNPYGVDDDVFDFGDFDKV